jgi:hypothetical protein
VLARCAAPASSSPHSQRAHASPPAAPPGSAPPASGPDTPPTPGRVPGAGAVNAACRSARNVPRCRCSSNDKAFRPRAWPKSFHHQTEVAVRATADLTFPTFVSFLHISPLAPEVLHRGYERARRCWRAHRAPRHRMCARRRPARLVLRPGRSFFGAKGPRKMDSPELVAVPCRECRRSPVEVLKRLRHGRQYLWCPQCRAIWVVERSASLTEPDPK